MGDISDAPDLLYTGTATYLVTGTVSFGLAAATIGNTATVTTPLGTVDPDPSNVKRANEALASFGSHYLLDAEKVDEILQIGIAPNRIDLLRSPEGASFEEAWARRIESSYGEAVAYWIDLDSLIAIKSLIDNPRHREDARILKKVRDRRGD